MKICLAQLNTKIGDFEGNLYKAKKAVETAARKGSDLVIFSELFITGYPPKDLLEQKFFLDRSERIFGEYLKLSSRFPSTSIVLGCVEKNGKGKGLYNSACVLHGGKKIFSQPKTLIPYYDVFDEVRYFDSSESSELFVFGGKKIGLTVCEDAWSDSKNWKGSALYEKDPIDILCSKGAELIINISASPYSVGKGKKRKEIFGNIAKNYGVVFIFLNQVGANDELIFDGGSFVFSKDAKPLVLLSSFEEEIAFYETGNKKILLNKAEFSQPEEIYKALKLGVRDYLGKCGFKKAVIGLSGGIDSAVTACIAAGAIGRENLTGITMPSRFSSKGSIDDSKALAENLGIDFIKIPIEQIYNAYLSSFETYFEGLPFDETEENIQARIRGNLLMAFSNKFGSMLLSTGNKSELAVGYCTLYGDMSGGLAVLSDVPKTTVYELASHINKKEKIIPADTILKPPSAELKFDQKDQDTLPPYEILDKILELLVEKNLSPDEIESRGFDIKTVNFIAERVFKNEHKRRQAAIGLRISEKAFGSGRRMPIAAFY